MAFDYVVAVPPFPNVPVAPGIPPMLRPLQAITAVLSGPDGLTALLSDNAALQSALGELSNADTLLANVPGAQALLANTATAQSLLYSVPGFGMALDDVTAAQQLVTTVPGLSDLLSNVPNVQAATSATPPADQSSTPDQMWGLVDSDNNPVVEADSIIKFEYMKDWKISNYPLEQGTFMSYNKVETPYQVRFVMAKGGELADVTQFLNDIQAAAKSTNLYSMTSPQLVYQNFAIDHVDWSQEATKGAFLMQVAVWGQEIRLTASTTVNAPSTSSAAASSPTVSNPQSASGTPAVSSGTVQPTAPASTQFPALTTPT